MVQSFCGTHWRRRSVNRIIIYCIIILPAQARSLLGRLTKFHFNMKKKKRNVPVRWELSKSWALGQEIKSMFCSFFTASTTVITRRLLWDSVKFTIYLSCIPLSENITGASRRLSSWRQPEVCVGRHQVTDWIFPKYTKTWTECIQVFESKIRNLVSKAACYSHPFSASTNDLQRLKVQHWLMIELIKHAKGVWRLHNV